MLIEGNHGCAMPFTSEMEEKCLSDIDGTVGSETPAAFAEIFYHWCALWARSEASISDGKALAAAD